MNTINKQPMFNPARWGVLVLAYFFLALALVGVVVPGLPTVPFLLLSAWFAAKGSQRLHRWLYQHPHFGKLLIDWEQQGAISRSSKVMAVVLILVAWLIMYLQFESAWLIAGVTLLLIGVVVFLISRPEP
ncbi:MAG: YbaN family protein [Candidatus Thiodiazotropha sp.]